MMKYDYEQFCEAMGRRVSQLRKERGMSHRRMVEEFGLHLDQIVKIEHGKSVSMQTVLKFCDAFDMTLEEFMPSLPAVAQGGTGAEELR